MTYTNETAPGSKTEGRNAIPTHPFPSVTENADTRQGYTSADARCIMARLRTPARDRVMRDAGRVWEPIRARSRFCCASAGLEDLAARAVADDPRCPCARAFAWHVEAAGVNA
jgi:hypothetical protein